IGIIAAVVLVIAAFVAFKNQQAYEVEINNLRDANTEKVRTTGELEVQQKRFKEAESSKESHALNLVETGKDRDTAIRKYDDLKKELATLEQTFEDKRGEIDSAKDVLKDLPSKDVLVPKINRLKNQLVEAQEGIANEESRIAKLNQKNQDCEQKIEALSQIIGDYAQGRSLASMSTSIRSIYSGWGFVILDGGDNDGVVPGSFLEVVRADEVIAKLKVTAVEAGRAAADIIKESMAPGEALRAGDAVIPEQKAEKPDDKISFSAR
ncbi:MAG: hypothetical protein P8P36_11010, partial [Akkermansiaceae bacterium]|nr:hypothetical protein [Akkermansiaceae bacterium]